MYIRIWLEGPHHGAKGLGHAQLTVVHGRETACPAKGLEMAGRRGGLEGVGTEMLTIL